MQSEYLKIKKVKYFKQPADAPVLFRKQSFHFQKKSYQLFHADKVVLLSAVIITYNEEKNIARCIDSLKGIANEIVVVDSFSTDNTVEICRQKKVKLVQHFFEGYIEQKNWAVTQATYPHILSLDADEYLSEELKQEIINAKNNWRCDGYYMKRLNNYCGRWIKHGVWYPEKKLRLWDSRKGAWGGENPHDKFVLNEGTVIGYFNNCLLHHPCNNVEQHLAKINKYSTIAALSKYQRGKKASFIKIIFSPLVCFLRGYFFKAGFLDGYHGLMIALFTAHATFAKYMKLWLLNNEK